MTCILAWASFRADARQVRSPATSTVSLQFPGWLTPSLICCWRYTYGPLSYLSMSARDSGDPAGLPPVGGGFVGRERELDRIGALLMGPARLVTLIGPGGIGKTRLAEEAARRLHRARHTLIFVARLARLPKGADPAAAKDAV